MTNISVVFDCNTSFLFNVKYIWLAMCYVIQIEQGINIIFLAKLNKTAIKSFKSLRVACEEDGRVTRSGLTTISLQNDFKLCCDACKARIERCATADGNDCGCR
jgi:hypothetical protein